MTPFLQDDAFDPDTLRAMSTALEEVCRMLKVDGDPGAREVMAVRIIELARRGQLDPKRLRDRVLREAGAALSAVDAAPVADAERPSAMVCHTFSGRPDTRVVVTPEEKRMLQNLAAEIINCYERARLAREKAERAINDDFKADFLAAEGRWLALAHSYELQHRLSQTVAEFDRRRKAGAITRMLPKQGVAFDPDDVTRLTIAYDAVLHRLGLVDHENGAALTVARRIVDLASLGERDPERLVATTLETLGSSPAATHGNDASWDGVGDAAELDQHLKYAEEAKRRADAAESENVKAAWLRVAQGWLSLLPQRY